jgi:hypothetical protein
VTPILTQGASGLPEDEIHDKDDHDDTANIAHVDDALSDGLGDNLSNVLGDNPREPKHTIQSEIASMQKIM